jgi:hypothetical protein
MIITKYKQKYYNTKMPKVFATKQGLRVYLDYFAFCIFGRESSIFEVLNVD